VITVSTMNDFMELHKPWIRESNLIEGIDDPVADQDSFDAWRRFTEVNLNIFTVLRAHGDIMWRNNKRIAGEFRKCNVSVGYRNCPNFKDVPNLMKKWFEVYRDADTFQKIKEAHIIFERIHPFADGNGRTGRMILNWQLMKCEHEIVCIYAVKRGDYYKWFAEEAIYWKGSLAVGKPRVSFLEQFFRRKEKDIEL